MKSRIRRKHPHTNAHPPHTGTHIYVVDIQGVQRRELFSTVRSFIYIIRRHIHPPDSSTQRRRDYTSPENALKPHIVSYIYTYIVKLVNLIFFRIAGLRTPAPDSESGVSIYPPARRCSVPSPRVVLHPGKPLTGLHVLLRTGRDLTSVAHLGRNSQKVLPRSCLGSLDSRHL